MGGKSGNRQDSLASLVLLLQRLMNGQVYIGTGAGYLSILDAANGKMSQTLIPGGDLSGPAFIIRRHAKSGIVRSHLPWQFRFLPIYAMQSRYICLREL
jgi:hypothetical protein